MALIDGNKKKGSRMMIEMSNTPIGPPYAIEESNYLNKVAAEITHELIGALISQPYFEYLKNIQCKGQIGNPAST